MNRYFISLPPPNNLVDNCLVKIDDKLVRKHTAGVLFMPLEGYEHISLVQGCN